MSFGGIPLPVNHGVNMSGKQQKFYLEFSPEDLEYLSSVANSRKAQARHQQRAKVLLLRANGASYTEIEKEMGLSSPTIAKIIKKAAVYGVKGALEDLNRSGRPKVISPEGEVWILSLACQIPETLPGAPQTQFWTTQALTDYIHKNCKSKGLDELEKISARTVWSILNNREIKPHRVKYYLKRKDPEFEDKAKKVLIIYKRIEWIIQLTSDQVADGKRIDELCGEVFLSYDEKPGIQAISNIAPDLPPSEKYKCLARDYEYKRHGTVTVLAAIDLFTGEVHALVREKHTSVEFIEFLKMVDSKYNKDLTINIILDNHSVHSSKETMKYLATIRKDRFNFIFTPKHASWLNLIECFFSKMARQALKHLRVKSKEDLIMRLENWFEETNREPVVFRWKWRLEDIENAIPTKLDNTA